MTEKLKREAAWLIERKLDGAPHWYAEDTTGWHDWLPDANLATRFKSRADAEAFRPYQLISSDPAISLTEHVFLAAQPHMVPAETPNWRCFHCDEVFTSEHDARLHFGRDEGSLPACQIKGSEHGLVEALRRAENDVADAWHAIHSESTDAAKAYHAQNGRHQEQLKAVEQVGYDRGLADAKAYPETLGLTVMVPAETDGEADELLARIQYLVALDEPENGGPYGGLAAAECMKAMREAAVLIEALRSSVAAARQEGIEAGREEAASIADQASTMFDKERHPRLDVLLPHNIRDHKRHAAHAIASAIRSLSPAPEKTVKP